MVACTFIRGLNTRIMNCKPYFSSSKVLRRCYDPLSLPTSEKIPSGTDSSLRYSSINPG